MQVGKILDAVVGHTTAGMVEASPLPQADAVVEEVAAESSQIAPSSPLPPQGSPTSVITVWEPMESMVAQLCRLQGAFRLRRQLTPA